MATACLAAAELINLGCSQQVGSGSPTAIEQRQECSYIIGLDDDRPIAVFPIRNDSAVEKRIENIRKSCNCYRSELTSKVIGRLQTESVSFFINRPTLKGPARKTIQGIVEFDDQSRCTCIAECMAYPSLAWNEKDAEIGNIDFNGTTKRQIPVVAYNHSRIPPEIGVVSQSPECKVDGPELNFTGSTETGTVWAHHGTISCAITPTVDRKGGGAAISLRRVDGGAEHLEVISLNWSTKSIYSLRPHMLVLRGVSDDPQTVAEVVVNREGGSSPVKIERLEHPHQELVHIDIRQVADRPAAGLKMSVKSALNGIPIYGDVLVYIEGCRSPISVPFVVVP